MRLLGCICMSNCRFVDNSEILHWEQKEAEGRLCKNHENFPDGIKRLMVVTRSRVIVHSCHLARDVV